MLVKASSKYHVIIPNNVRNTLQIKVGSKVQVVVKGSIALLIPVRSIRELQKLTSGKLSFKKSRAKNDRDL